MKLALGLQLFSHQYAAGGGVPGAPTAVDNGRGNAVGTTAGGNTVTIQVPTSTGLTGAKIDGNALTSFATVDGTHVSGIAPAGSAGLKDVVTTNAFGDSLPLSNGYRYWNPLVLSGKVLLQQDSRTLSGSNITQVADQYGNGFHVDAASNFPTVGSTLNGKPTASHTSSEQLTGTWTWQNVMSNSAHHFMAVLKPANANDGGRFIEDASQWIQMSISGKISGNHAAEVFWGAPTNLDNTNIALVDNTWYLFESYLSGGTLHLLINGAHAASAAASNLGGSGSIKIGGLASAFDWASIVCFDAQLSGTDQGRFYDYFATHYGLSI